MRTILKHSRVLIILLAIGLATTSCKKEVEYQVRVYNLMQNEFLGFPFMKYDIAEFKIGENVIPDVKYGQFSDYVTVRSGNEYSVSVTVNKYLYNLEYDAWLADGTETFNLDPETWGTDDEKTYQVIQLKIGDLFSLYKPYYTVHYDPDQPVN